MLRFFHFILLCALMSFNNASFSFANSNREKVILTIPKSAIKQTVQTILPLDIDVRSKNLAGTIIITEVRNLQFKEHLLFCQCHVIGKNLNITAKIAEHPISLRVGDMELDFSTNISIKFDKELNKLILKPRILNISTSRDQAEGYPGKTLAALLDQQEFPIDLNTIKPIKAKAGNKSINIRPTLSNAKITPEGLQLYFAPKVTSQ